MAKKKKHTLSQLQKLKTAQEANLTIAEGRLQRAKDKGDDWGTVHYQGNVDIIREEMAWCDTEIDKLRS